MQANTRISYDGGSAKTTPYHIEITANADKRRQFAEIAIIAYWDDGKCPRSSSSSREICRQCEADRVYSDLLALLARAGIYPTPTESDELHTLLAQVCMCVKAA